MFFLLTETSGVLTSSLTEIAKYRTLFVAALDVLIIVATLIIGVSVVKKVMAMYKEYNSTESKESLRNMDYSKTPRSRRASIIRHVIAADGVDPGPNGYMVINDSGQDVYLRSFTITKLPKRTVFANTFAGLFDFPGCTSSVFVEPITEAEMIRRLDRQINILESEYISASGNVNRQRKLGLQQSETESWSRALETGNNSFYNVGFLFTIYADDIVSLNKQSDAFRALALAKGMDISNCFAVQPEAYLSNAPLCRKVSINTKLIKADAIKTHQMDKYSLSTVYNYTESSFSHKYGIPLGRDMFTKKPFVFDVYDGSHDGFTILVFGKTGSGKSATIKIMCCRYRVQGYRFVCIDSQARKGTGEGEYATCAELMNGVNFQISAASNNILNLFDVQESKKFVKDSASSGHEVLTLELTEKIIQCVNSIITMVQGSNERFDGTTSTYMNRIVTDTVTAVYDEYGIKNGEPDSLYEAGQVIENGQLTSGKVRKKLPVFSDFYKKLLIANRDNDDAELAKTYRILLFALKDYVREVYYTANSVHFLTKDEYENLPLVEQEVLRDNKRVIRKVRVWVNEQGDHENVYQIHGIRPYYDGQSTLRVSQECAFTNIDISQLTESEKVVAREIALGFVNENYIKKNSENLSNANKLLCIFDEAHENFVYEYARKTLSNIVRTARKRNVAILFSTQTVKEYDRYPETQDILKQAAVKLIAKQDYQDMEYLMDALNLTESQANYIVTNLGGNMDTDTKNLHRGEMCLVDGNKVAFIKVDYIRKTEALAVETDSAEIEKLFTVTNRH